MMNLRLLFLAALFVALGCEGSQSNERVPYRLLFRTTSDTGNPLTGVSVFVNDKEIGRSKEEGLVRGRVEAPPHGVTIQVAWKCPAGYRQPKKKRPILLNVAQDEGTTGNVNVETAIQCLPIERRLALVVRTNLDFSVPVEVNGAVVAYTNEKGVATYATMAKPGTAFDVILRTQNSAIEGPLNPSRKWILKDSDAIVTFDQTFKIGDVKKRRRRKKRTQPRNPRPKREFTKI